MTDKRAWPVRRLLAAAAVIALGASTVACTAQEPADPTSGPGDSPAQIAIQVAGEPISLNPALTNAGLTNVYQYLAYDPLIYLAADGSYQPDLATEWEYVDPQTFRITLREGVVFSDGEALDAEALKTWLEYLKTATGTGALQIRNLESVTVDSELVATLSFSAPTPLLERTFSQIGVAGLIASPAAVADPAKLDTDTFGAGQYVLDVDNSVTGQQTVYVPNPTYWNPDAVHFDQVTLKTIADPQTALAALQAGDVDVVYSGNPTTAPVAAGAGFTVATAPYVAQGLILADRNGEVSSELGDVRIREAINYAIDRAAVAAAVGGEFYTPSSATLTEGSDGWSKELDTTFPYDPEKAKSLLAEAGHPDGFTMKVLGFAGTDPNSLIAQAIASELAKVGITLDLVQAATYPEFQTELASKAYPAFILPLSPMPMYAWYNNYVAPPAFQNPFQTTDAQIDQLMLDYQQDQSPAIALEIAERLQELVWFGTVFHAPLIVFSSADLVNVGSSPGRYLPNPVSPIPSEGWQPAS